MNWFLIFLVLSLAVNAVALYYSVGVYRRNDRSQRTFSALLLYTMGTFLSMWLLYIPIYYSCFAGAVRPLLLSLYHTIRVMIVDGDYEILERVTFTAGWLEKLYLGWFTFLLVWAPILTFSNILYLFRNLTGELWYRMSCWQPLYIMSELNDESIAMAESIMDRYWKSRPQGIRWWRNPRQCFAFWRRKPLIVFTDVFTQNDEEDYEMLGTIRQLNAVCMKKDAAHLKLEVRENPQIEIFLLGKDESENVHQAIQLTEKLKHRQNISIYVYAQSPGAGFVVDSLDKGNRVLDASYIRVVQEAIHRKERNGDAREALEQLKKKGKRIDSGFYIRRINCVQSLVMDTLKQPDTLRTVRAAAQATGSVSILIVGLGKYGREYLKNAVWFFQSTQWNVDIHVVDAKPEDALKKKLEMDIPELIQINPSNRPGDAHYQIHFHGGIDCFSGELTDLLQDPQTGADLRHTQLVFVSLGDDDRNIEAAVLLRRLFDRVKGVTKKQAKNAAPDELPIIYSVVFDDQKADNLNIGAKTKDQLRNFDESPFNIRFIGALASQYSYNAVEQNKNVEEEAILYHMGWVETNLSQRAFYWLRAKSIALAAEWGLTDEQQRLLQFSEIVENYYMDQLRKERPAGAPDPTPAELDQVMREKIPLSDPYIDTPDYVGMIRQYTSYEYYRDSSIAKAVYEDCNPELFDPIQTHYIVCTCADCERKRISEHMRWNAYMRSRGHTAGPRNDRAKRHPDLVPWNELDILERFKD